MAKTFIISVQNGESCKHVTVGVNKNCNHSDWKYFDKWVDDENYPLPKLMENFSAFFKNEGVTSQDLILCPDENSEDVVQFIFDAMLICGKMDCLTNLVAKQLPTHNETWGPARAVGELCMIIGKEWKGQVGA